MPVLKLDVLLVLDMEVMVMLLVVIVGHVLQPTRQTVCTRDPNELLSEHILPTSRQ